MIHPSYPGHTLTMRHLLTHTASIGSNTREELKDYVPGDGFTRTKLSDFILPYLSDPANWLSNPPGNVTYYSNIGAGLAALIVERIAKISFERYVQEQILERLGIGRKQASYRLSDF